LEPLVLLSFSDEETIVPPRAPVTKKKDTKNKRARHPLSDSSGDSRSDADNSKNLLKSAESGNYDSGNQESDGD
jgi:hypothetical protein